MVTSIRMDILAMELVLIEDQDFLFPGGGFGQNVLIFGANMSSSAHIDNKKKTYWSLEKDQHKG